MAQNLGMRKRAQIGIEFRFISAASSAGFEDLNPWIDFLLDTLKKKSAQIDAMQRELIKSDVPKESPTEESV